MTTRRRGFHPEPSPVETVKTTVATTLLWFVGLVIIGWILAPFPFPSAMFYLIQIGLLMSDLGEAENSNKRLPIFTAAVVNLLIGLGLHDPIMWGFASLVIIIAIARALNLFD